MEIYRTFLKQAIEQAKQTGAKGNFPCGSVVIDSNSEIIVASGNEAFSTPDVTAHAEMMCLRRNSELFMDKNSQKGYVLFSTCEPCGGCAFYIARTNIKKIIYASKDRYRPGISMLKKDPKFSEYFDSIEIIEEPFNDLRDEALIIMRDYFLTKDRPDTAKFFEPLG